MYKVRLLFSKTGPAAYISHLDLMKTFQRAFRRAHLPVRYSQGFNPHIYLSILAPLSTGYESDGDVCDFDLTEAVPFDAVVARLNETLPPGLTALRAGEPDKKPGRIARSVYTISYPAGDCHAMAQLFDGEVTVEKRSKRGSREVRLADYIVSIAFESVDGATLCSATVKAGDDPLNPLYISRVLQRQGLVPQDYTPSYTRKAILDDNNQIFF